MKSSDVHTYTIKTNIIKQKYSLFPLCPLPFTLPASFYLFTFLMLCHGFIFFAIFLNFSNVFSLFFLASTFYLAFLPCCYMSCFMQLLYMYCSFYVSLIISFVFLFFSIGSSPLHLFHYCNVQLSLAYSIDGITIVFYTPTFIFLAQFFHFQDRAE